MNEVWGVTDAGYEILARTGLEKRLDDAIVRGHMGGFVEASEVEELLQRARPERKEAAQNFLQGIKNPRPEDLFMVSGDVADAILTKEELQKPEQFGVHDLSELDGLLAAYVLSSRFDEFSRSYVWRSNGLKTSIAGYTDGDLHIDQMVLIPDVAQNPDGTQRLFARLPRFHIGADYSFWPVLAATALKYADTVGAEIQEAKNWREYLTSLGWDSKIAETSSWGVGFDSFAMFYFNTELAQIPDKTNVREIKKQFFGIMQPNADHETIYVPAIEADDQWLAFYSNRGAGEPVELAPYGTPLKFYPRVYIPKEDASHLFRGAVQGIMTGNSRTRPEFLAYMLWQHEQIKAGKSEEQISKEGEQFDRL